MAPSHMFSCKYAVTGCYVCLQCPGRCLDDGTLALHSECALLADDDVATEKCAWL